LKAKNLIQTPPLSSSLAQLETTAEEIRVDEESDAVSRVEPTRTVAASKSKLSEEEIRLGEEAFLNALIELEALGQTSPQVATESTEKVESNQGAQVGESLPSETHSIQLPSQTSLAEDGLSQDEVAPIAPVPCTEAEIEISDDRFDISADISDDKYTDISGDLIRRLKSDSPNERAAGLAELAQLGGEGAFGMISQSFDDQVEDVRNAAARALFDLQPDRAASFARALREASPERRWRIGAAIAASGLAEMAIGDLSGQTREQGYEAFSLLFLMTKAGEVKPMLQAVEDHPSIDVRLTVVKLLALNGHAEVLPVFRHLAVCGILPAEVRAAVIDAIYELGRQIPRQVLSGAKT
jgi:hypothetical protein